MQPRGLLLDFGNTLVEERSFDPRAGNEWLLTRVTHKPAHITIDDILDRAVRVTSETAARRDQFQMETPFPMLNRLIYDYFGVRFADPVPVLELGFWKASVVTRPMPGARAALEQLHAAGARIGVLSNASFSEAVIHNELAKHGLAEHIECVVVSSDYCLRKPNVLLFEVAAARLGVTPGEVWVVGDRMDTDVLGARAAGMTSVWFGQRSLSESLIAVADFTVCDWNELVRTFQEAGAAPSRARV